MDITRPLWKLLIVSSGSEETAVLTCDECFVILEYLANLRSESELDDKRLLQMAAKHLAGCTDCRDYYMRQLAKMEAVQANNGSGSRNTKGKNGL